MAVDTFLLRLHQRQVAHQCRVALLAAGHIQQGLLVGNQDILWAAVQNFLGAAACISKACWGQGGKLAVERASLRASLGVLDDSPIANTDLRNHLEHYDERLDRWYEESVGYNHADFLIGPADRTIVGLAATDVFRHFDPQTGHVIFWGKHYSIPDLVAAIQALLPIADVEGRKPHWDPSTGPHV